MHEHQKTWSAADWQRFQQMKDDRIVNEYMAEIDTRIDRVVLEWRMTDVILDGIMGFTVTPDWIGRSLANRTIAERGEHVHRADDLQRMIEEIRCADGFTIPPERDSGIGFGPYDANDDKYLSMVLDYAGSDFADEETGCTDFGEHVMRFGRCLLGTDSQGFRTLVVHEHEVEAVAEFNKIDDEFSTWSAQNEEGY